MDGDMRGGSYAQIMWRRQVEEALHRYSWSRTDRWIAEHLGLTEKSVERWRCRLGCWRTQQRGWYTTAEAARVTGLSVDDLRRMAQNRQIRARRIVKRRGCRYSRWLIAPESVEALVAERNAGLWRKRGTAWR